MNTTVTGAIVYTGHACICMFFFCLIWYRSLDLLEHPFQLELNVFHLMDIPWHCHAQLHADLDNNIAIGMHAGLSLQWLL